MSALYCSEANGSRDDNSEEQVEGGEFWYNKIMWTYGYPDSSTRILTEAIIVKHEATAAYDYTRLFDTRRIPAAWNTRA
jgi:hypothetical protein